MYWLPIRQPWGRKGRTNEMKYRTIGSRIVGIQLFVFSLEKEDQCGKVKWERRKLSYLFCNRFNVDLLGKKNQEERIEEVESDEWKNDSVDRMNASCRITMKGVETGVRATRVTSWRGVLAIRQSISSCQKYWSHSVPTTEIK